jgi:hypothetical protein
MQKLDQLYGETVDSSHTELFTVNPKQSYIPGDWIKGDPSFWKSNPAAMGAKPTATNKPAQ